MTTRTRNVYYKQPSVPDYETAATVFAEYVAQNRRVTPTEVTLHRNGSRDYTLSEDMLNGTSYALHRNGKPVIRYGPPNAQGVRMVEVYNLHTASMSQFFKHHGWQGVSPRLVTTDDRTVFAPFVPGQLSVLIFNAAGKLEVAESSHGTLFVRRTSDEHAEEAKRVWSRVEPVAFLALANLHNLLENAELRSFYSRHTLNPGASAPVDWLASGAAPDWPMFSKPLTVIMSYALGKPEATTDAALPILMLLAQEVVNFLYTRAYTDKVGGHIPLFRSPATTTTMWNQAAQEAVTSDRFLDAYKQAVLDACGLRKVHTKAAVPQFPERLPKRVFL